MVATNEILPFATDPGANVMTQVDYDALAARGEGFVAGIARSEQLNKVWRQSSFVSAALAQFIADQDIAVVDDGDVQALADNFVDALNEIIEASIPSANVFTGGTTTGSGNAQVITTVSPPSSSFTNGQSVICTAGFTNSGSATFNAGGEGALIIKKDVGGGLTNLTGGEITATDSIVLVKNTTIPCWVLTNGIPLGSTATTNLDTTNFQNSAGFLAFGTAPVLPSAATGTTQTAADNSTKLATTAYVDRIVPTVQRRQYITTNTPYTPHANMLYCLVEVVGGGAGGGGGGTSGSGSFGSAGGAGEFCSATFSKATIGASQTVSLGAAGSGGSTGNDGTNGGTTTFGALISCAGGVKGITGTGSGALGGLGGSSGSFANGYSPGQSGTSGYNPGVGTVGGSSPFGSGGLGSAVFNSGGSSARGYGAGGGSGVGSGSGGNGTAGAIRITEYCSA